MSNVAPPHLEKNRPCLQGCFTAIPLLVFLFKPTITHEYSLQVSQTELQYIVDNVLQKAVDGMNEDGCPFVGILFAGIMLTTQGPKVLEFNCRFGDPGNGNRSLLSFVILARLFFCIDCYYEQQPLCFI